jgi:hypothetical protein
VKGNARSEGVLIAEWRVTWLGLAMTSVARAKQDPASVVGP